MPEGVSYFGSYDPNYSRNRIIIKGLEKNGIAVYQCQAQGLVIFRYLKLLKQFLKCRYNINAIIVGFPGHYDVPLAFVLGKVFGKKVFFDIFASTYETYVQDREVVKKKSFQAKFFYVLDWLGFILCDYVIVDTKSHADFYQNFYKTNSDKIIVVYVGSDNEIFYPRQKKQETDVLFYGSYQPLQGVNKIIEAAKLLPSVSFQLIGEGQTKPEAIRLSKSLKLKNINFITNLPIKELAVQMNKAKIILGIFGTSQKSNNVIPNKVYDALSSRKPIITAKTQAHAELFKNGKDIILINPNNAKILAGAIQKMLLDIILRDKIAKGGYLLYKKRLTPEKVVSSLIKYLK